MHFWISQIYERNFFSTNLAVEKIIVRKQYVTFEIRCYTEIRLSKYDPIVHSRIDIGYSLQAKKCK